MTSGSIVWMIENYGLYQVDLRAGEVRRDGTRIKPRRLGALRDSPLKKLRGLIS